MADLNSLQTEQLVRQYVEPLLSQGVDTLVLGCTHYPFLSDVIQRIAGKSVSLIDPADAVARELSRRLSEHAAAHAHKGRVQFFTSGNDVQQAQVVMSHLWPEPLTVQSLGA